MFVCQFTCLFMRVVMFVLICGFACGFTCVRGCGRAHLCECVVCVCVCVCVYMCMCTCIRMCVCIVCVYAYVRTCPCTLVRERVFCVMCVTSCLLQASPMMNRPTFKLPAVVSVYCSLRIFCNSTSIWNPEIFNMNRSSARATQDANAKMAPPSGV